MKFLVFIFSLSSTLAVGQIDCVNCPPLSSVPLPTVTLPEVLPSLIDIKKVSYQRRSSVKHCKRPIDLVDTIVLHHSESSSQNSPQRINSYHLDRGWYMGGYTYLVNSPYRGESTPASVVTEGRPPELVGAHAGTDAYVPMRPKDKDAWNAGQILCGVEGGQFSPDSAELIRTKIVGGQRVEYMKANVTTIGVSVIGQYFGNAPRFQPTSNTLDMIAKLICRLQKENPNMVNLRVHNNYHPTDCPGNLGKASNLSYIVQKAQSYGCNFSSIPGHIKISTRINP